MIREDNRTLMPVIASVVDELRAQGIGVKVLYARENGIERGVRPDWVQAEIDAGRLPKSQLKETRHGQRSR